MWHKQKGFSRSGHNYPRHKKPEHVWLLFLSEREKLKGSQSWQQSICLLILTFIVWLGIANSPTNLISSLQDIHIHQDHHSPTTEQTANKAFHSLCKPISEYPLQQVREPSIKGWFFGWKTWKTKALHCQLSPLLRDKLETISHCIEERLNRHQKIAWETTVF